MLSGYPNQNAKLLETVLSVFYFPSAFFFLPPSFGISIKNAYLCQQSLPSNAVKILRIEPADWFVGMKNTLLQLMVSGPDVATVKDVAAAGCGVRMVRVARLDSPNYLFVDLDLRNAEPGEVTLSFDGTTVSYRLHRREKDGRERQGFTHADVLYLLMPDRFAQGGGQRTQTGDIRPYRVDRRQPSLRHGGDLEGICQHLDYFCELGVTALWLTPVLENNSPDRDGRYSTYHGYATTDFYRVDPRLGTLEDYRRLCDEAHGRGLKVVMDLVFNHCSIDHPWMSDLPAHDWIHSRLANARSVTAGTPHLQTSYKLTPVLDPYASLADRRETVEGWFTDDMPDLNQRNPYLMRYLIQCSKWWIETVGIDGIRMDTYPYADAEAMGLWVKELDDEYPHFNIVGETWVGEPAFTAAWQGRGLKTVMDFAFYDRMRQARNEETDGWWQGLNRIYHVLAYDYLYKNPDRVLAFLDNHDTDRFLGDGRNVKMLQQALVLLLTVRRTPQLYYGTEILMNGTAAASDGNVRRDFPGGFPGDRRNAFTAAGRTKAQQDMFDWLSRLLHWRKGNEAIVRGRQTQFLPCEGAYVVARQWEGHTVMAVLNGTSHAATMHVDRYAEIFGAATEATDVLTGRSYRLTLDVPLRPRQSLLLEFFSK